MVPTTDPDAVPARREAERRFRRELILEAAERVFGRRPFHEATMQMIAEAADLGMYGIYEHFPSKEALYEAVILRRAERFLARIDQELERAAGPMEQLRAVARVRVEAFFEAPAFLPVFLSELVRFDWGVASRSAPRIHGVFRRVRERVQEVMRGAVAAGLLRPLGPDLLARLFMDAVTEVLATGGAGAGGEGAERCIDLAMDVFLSGAAAR